MILCQVQILSKQELILCWVSCRTPWQQEALQRVKNSFRGSMDVDEPEAGDDDSDDELMATATRLSLRCPVGLVSAFVLVSFCALAY